MGLKLETTEVHQKRQKVARVFDAHLAGPNIDKETVTVLLNSLMGSMDRRDK